MTQPLGYSGTYMVHKIESTPIPGTQRVYNALCGANKRNACGPITFQPVAEMKHCKKCFPV